jgi:Ca2+-binding EF-hand superfamily protein
MALSHNFGPFTSSEVSSAFHSFDLDHNNYVGAAELRAIYKQLGEEVTDEEIDEMIRMVDLDGDGQINLKEFTSMIFSYAPQKAEKKPRKMNRSAAVEVDEYENDIINELIAKTASNGSTTVKAAAESKINDENNNPPSENKSLSDVSVFTIAQSRQRCHELRVLLTACNLTADSITSLLSQYSSLDLDIDNEVVKYDEMLSYLNWLDSGPNLELFHFFDDERNGLANIRNMLASLSFYSNQTAQERLEYLFILFDRDKAGTLLDEDLLDLLKSTHLATSNTSMKKKVEQIIKYTKQPEKGEISLEEFIKVHKKFPSLIFPPID